VHSRRRKAPWPRRGALRGDKGERRTWGGGRAAHMGRWASAAIGDAGGAERAVTGHDDVGACALASDWGAQLKWVLGNSPVGQPDTVELG
jgi:hypothetical protein